MASASVVDAGFGKASDMVQEFDNSNVADSPMSEAETYFRWAYRLAIALAKRCKEDEDSMHRGQDWNGLVGTSHSMYMNRARAEAGIDHEEFLNVVRNKIDVSEIYDESIGR